MKTAQRHGLVIRVKPEKLDEYTRYHANAWPEILDMLRRCNIRNYSIFHKDGWLFSYFEYIGDDFEADMKRLSTNPKNQEWRTIMSTMQKPLETRKEGEWWAEMENVFYME